MKSPAYFLIAAIIAGMSVPGTCAPEANAPVTGADTTTAGIIGSAEEMKARIPTELHVTNPDYIVFVPQLVADKVSDTGNEELQVFDGPDGSLMAVWTQSTMEGKSDQHIVFARSDDEGKTWSVPKIIAGPAKTGEGPIAVWAFPLVSKSGRIYVLYDQNTGKYEPFFYPCGVMTGIYSDDNGRTWSQPQTIPMPRSIRDNPDTTYPANWIVWQKPLRLTKDDKYLVGFTRWSSKRWRTNPTKWWISQDSVVEFMRFDNIDENPEPAKLQIAFLMQNERALTVPYPGYPNVSVCQEPSIVKLPDGRLFCVMRTGAGSPFWSKSSDDGENWTTPSRLLRRDGGEPLLHPLSPCPIYDMGDTKGSGRYVLFTHNHDGHYQGYGPMDTNYHRRPICIVTGHFKAGADQPVWFDEPRPFMDHKGVKVGAPGTKGRLDLAMYDSFTVRKGKAVLWYPERKFFLLGRVIGDEWFGSEQQQPGKEN